MKADNDLTGDCGCQYRVECNVCCALGECVNPAWHGLLGYQTAVLVEIGVGCETAAGCAWYEADQVLYHANKEAFRQLYPGKNRATERMEERARMAALAEEMQLPIV